MTGDFEQDLPGLVEILKQAAGEGEKELFDPGPGDVQPTLQIKGAATSNAVDKEMGEEELKEWREEIDRARERIKAREGAWDALLRDYMPTTQAGTTPQDVKMMTHFRNVHSRMGELFYATPDIVLTAKDPSPAQNMLPNPIPPLPGMPPLPPIQQDSIISTKQAILKDKLGRNGIKAERLFDELLFDLLAWTGIAGFKVGYKCVTKMVPKPVMGPDPNAQAMPPGPGSILGLGGGPPQMVPQVDPATGQPLMTQEEIPIHESYYGRRVSPKKLLFNSDLFSSRHQEDSTWIGMDIFFSLKRAQLPLERGGLGLSEDEAAKGVEDDRRFLHDDDTSTKKPGGMIRATELYCRAEYYSDEVNPEVYRQLILVDGVDRAIVWRPSPDQTLDELGKLTPDSVRGNPFRILTVRDLADSPFPISDSAATNPEVKALTTWLQQSIMLRDAAIGMYVYDSGIFSEPGTKEHFDKGGIGARIPVPAGALKDGVDRLFATTAQVHSTPDDYRGYQTLRQNVDETVGMSAIQAGTELSTVKSATEVSKMDRHSNSRNSKEQRRVTDVFLDLAEMLDQLLMRYATDTDYVLITGEDGLKKILPWNNKTIAGRYIYDISPDSQSRPDNSDDFEKALKLYNITAADPQSNRAYILRKLYRAMGWDPAKAVLDPLMMMAQPPHGGGGAGGGPINSHENDKSGKAPNAPDAQGEHREAVKAEPPSITAPPQKV